MLVVIKRRYKKQHVIKAAGIFDTITGVFKKLFASGVANRFASTALSAGKDAARELGKKALEVGKNTAIEAGKRLVDKAAAKLLASTIPLPRAVETLAPPTLTRENAAILARLIDNGVGPSSNAPSKLTPENAAILARLTDNGARPTETNINLIC